jgi:hypothetical protein
MPGERYAAVFESIGKARSHWGQDLPAMLASLQHHSPADLHLAVSVRSFRAEKLSEFVGALIAGEPLTNSDPTNRPSRATDFGISSAELRVSQEVFDELPSILLPPILHIQLTIRALPSSQNCVPLRNATFVHIFRIACFQENPICLATSFPFRTPHKGALECHLGS